MAISMYQTSVPVLIRMMNNLSAILKKGEAFAKEKEIEPEVLMNSRLAVDMFPLSRQIQTATDVTRRGIERLAGIDVTGSDDNEQSFSDFYDRINTTVSFLESIKPDQIDGSEENPISLEVRGHVLNFNGMEFILSFTLPNVYFHVTTVYNILRHNGVELGKTDFLGNHPG